MNIAMLILGLIAGILIGAVYARNYIFNHVAAGECLRAQDGEVYLRITEQTQHLLEDPRTQMLFIRVVDE